MHAKAGRTPGIRDEGDRYDVNMGIRVPWMVPRTRGSTRSKVAARLVAGLSRSEGRVNRSMHACQQGQGTWVAREGCQREWACDGLG